jgi:hypothetical protein
MKNFLLVLGVLVMSAGALAGPGPSFRALSILDGKAVLCYGAVVEVNHVRDDSLGTQADTVLASSLSDLKLEAKRYDGKCDRLLKFTFQIIFDEPPSVYSDELELVSYSATDRKSDTRLAEVTVWREGNYGGEVRILTPEEYTGKMRAHLQAMLELFKTDFISNQFALKGRPGLVD